MQATYLSINKNWIMVGLYNAYFLFFSGRLHFQASGRAVVPGGAQPRWRHAEG
jgi:hypothetical protein